MLYHQKHPLEAAALLGQFVTRVEREHDFSRLGPDERGRCRLDRFQLPTNGQCIYDTT